MDIKFSSIPGPNNELKCNSLLHLPSQSDSFRYLKLDRSFLQLARGPYGGNMDRAAGDVHELAQKKKDKKKEKKKTRPIFTNGTKPASSIKYLL